MFDCGNSRMRPVHKDRKYRATNSGHRKSKYIYVDSDSVSDCVDIRRGSGRRITHKSHSRPHHNENRGKLTIIEFDGGNSKSIYPSGPVIDLGTSTQDPPDRNCNNPVEQPCVRNIRHCSPPSPVYSRPCSPPRPRPVCDDDRFSGMDDMCDKLVFDGGGAAIDIC